MKSASSTAMERDHLISAARPTLFDAVAYPDVLMAMVLANLTSPLLWEFRDRVQNRIAADESSTRSATRDSSSYASAIEEIQQYCDHHLSHLAPLEVADQWGNVELSEIADRYGETLLTSTMELIRENLAIRQAEGRLQPNQDVLAMIDEGVFPEYDYSIVELIRAHRTLLGRKKHKPWGVTICADEAVLIASLACALDQIPLQKCVVFGSPLHYAVLLEHSRRAVMVNGKQESFSEQEWQDSFPTPVAAIAALDRLVPIDRFIAAGGVVDLTESVVTMSPEAQAHVSALFSRFLGASLPQLERSAHLEPLSANQPPTWAWERLDGCSSADEARLALAGLAAQYPDSVLGLARYTARELDVPDPAIYLDAALRGSRLRAAAAAVTDVATALDLVRAVPGQASPLDVRERIALPDEVLTMGTGDEVDRGLMLLALFTSQSARLHSRAKARQLVVTVTGAFVGTGADWIDAQSLDSVLSPSGEVLCRIGSSEA